MDEALFEFITIVIAIAITAAILALSWPAGLAWVLATLTRWAGF